MNYLELKKNIRDAARGSTKGLSEFKILIVEHQDSSANTLFNMLKSLGFNKIDKARTTSQSLNLIDRNRYEIYFINYRLKGEDLGINLIDHLYGYGYQENALCFLLLNEKEKMPHDFPPEYNSDGILKKPFKTNKICSMVSDGCTKKITRLETTGLLSTKKDREAVILNLQTSGKDKNKIWGTLAAGAIYEKGSNFEDAVTLYRAILKLYPHCAIAYDAIGLVLRKLGRNSEAEHNFISSADKNPYYLKAKHHLAELYYWNEQKEKARQILKLALRVNPLSVITNKEFAMVSNDLGDHEAAKKALKIVLQNSKEAENPHVLIDYGNTLVMNMDLDEAIENFNKSIDTCKTQEDMELQAQVLKKAMMAKGKCYLKYDDPEKQKLAEGCFNAAEKALKKTEVTQDFEDDFKLEIGKSYLENGMDEKAEKTLSEFIDTDPKNKGRQEKVTGIFKLFNRVKKAMELIENAVQKAMDDIEERDKENRKLKKEGKFKEAVESYKELIERYPSDDGLHFNVGRTYLDWSKKLGVETLEGMDKTAWGYKHFKMALELDRDRIAPALETIGVNEKELDEMKVEKTAEETNNPEKI